MADKRKAASEQVSELTTNRLSVYLRCLTRLESAGVETISSQALAEQFHLNAAQIRKDLAYFGEFGVRGVGYYVKDLKLHLRQILGLDRRLKVAVMGAGNLGQALADQSDPFRKALLLSLSNPKAILFFISFFIQFVDPGYAYPGLSFLVLGTILEIISALYLSFLIFSGVRLAAWFRRRQRLAAGASSGVGALFVGFGVKLASATLS